MQSEALPPWRGAEVREHIWLKPLAEPELQFTEAEKQKGLEVNLVYLRRMFLFLFMYVWAFFDFLYRMFLGSLYFYFVFYGFSFCSLTFVI